jgi:hypothetical protein
MKGLTIDSGWEFGIRRTVPIAAPRAWDFLLSPEGYGIWLGDVRGIEWTEGKEFSTSQGVDVILSTIRSASHMRMKWRKKGWVQFSMLQIRVVRGIGKCVIAFHHDRLLSADQREEMKSHWAVVMKKLEDHLKS